LLSKESRMLSPVELLRTEQATGKTIPPSASGSYREYLPSILLIAERFCKALAHKGCKVYQTEANSEGLARASQNYFDVIVLDMDQSAEKDLAVYQKLKRYPELADIPLVILFPGDTPPKSTDEFKQGSVYFLTKDAYVGSRLWQIIEQVHYLTYRYLVLVPA
jgi:CheY-like chemotaxis protein